MIYRDLISFLERWKNSPSRLPLLLRGARQVGKTTLIQEFGKTYQHFLYFNLELSQDISKFSKADGDLNALLQLLFISRNVLVEDGESCLICIDEIQEKPELIGMLRYFHEQFPWLHLIATGSLLEFAMDQNVRIPVGRIEFAELFPLSFREYLRAKGEHLLLAKAAEIPLNLDYHPLLLNHFHEYSMLGGMPMLVNSYLADRQILRLRDLFHAIIESYKTDVMKYAKNRKEATIIRSVIDVIPYEIDNRIILSKFGNLGLKSNDLKIALQKLESARWIKLVYPTVSTRVPAVLDFGKSPRLHFLDIGMVNFQLGILPEYLQIDSLDQLPKSKLIQQVVYQEMLANSKIPLMTFPFWVRQERGTSSEVDMIYNFQNKLIPIEIKSGSSGKLRSLHEFMDRCPHSWAVRIYAGKVSIDHLKSRTGKNYKLLNIPYFLTGWLDEYLIWMEQQ